MTRYRIVHTTGFRYDSEVVASYNEARMLPARDDHQLVFATKLEIQPHGSSHEYFDYFNTRAVMFEVLEPHSELTITSTSVVELRPALSVTPGLNWEDLEAEITSDLELVDAVSQTKRTTPPGELGKFARKEAQVSTPHETAMAICRKVFNEMTYKHGFTGVHSIATEAWSAKIGVCQDYAHIAIGAMRSAGIPARYVSGYLHPSLDPVLGDKVVGESHAWVEWWAGSWFAFDPTNNVDVADRHIVVGRGRDYDDVAPLRGVYAGAVYSELFVSVEITKEA